MFLLHPFILAHSKALNLETLQYFKWTGIECFYWWQVYNFVVIFLYILLDACVQSQVCAMQWVILSRDRTIKKTELTDHKNHKCQHPLKEKACLQACGHGRLLVHCWCSSVSTVDWKCQGTKNINAFLPSQMFQQGLQSPTDMFTWPKATITHEGFHSLPIFLCLCGMDIKAMRAFLLVTGDFFYSFFLFLSD